MKRIIFHNILILILSAYVLYGNGAEFAYSLGDVIVQDPADDIWFPEAGDTLAFGETVITGEDGEVELQRHGSYIRIEQDTVFTLLESELEGTRRDVFSCISGAVKFKIDQVTGIGPEINTLSAVAGIRGTEFTVFTGSDGTSMLIVTEGVVDVSSSGEMVRLLENEGVEVLPGTPPGEKFQVLRGQVDFREWNRKNETRLMEDPVAAVYRIMGLMEHFAGEAREMDTLFNLNRLRLTEVRDILKKMKETESREKVDTYYKETVFPLEVETSYMRMNVRYWALSALSLRRYTLSGIYFRTKARYTGNPGAREYRDFISSHENVMKLFEMTIVPFLVEADI